MPGEGPQPTLDLRDLDAMFPVEESERAELKHSLGDDRLRRKHGECRDLLESLATAMAGDALMRELSEGSCITRAQFDRLTAGTLWFSQVSSIDQRDPVWTCPQF
jgi:hypothetical protein